MELHEREAVQAALSKSHPGGLACLCRASAGRETWESWHVHDVTVLPDPKRPRGLAVVPIRCTHCGLVLTFAASAMGL